MGRPRLLWPPRFSSLKKIDPEASAFVVAQLTAPLSSPTEPGGYNGSPAAPAWNKSAPEACVFVRAQHAAPSFRTRLAWNKSAAKSVTIKQRESFFEGGATHHHPNAGRSPKATKASCGIPGASEWSCPWWVGAAPDEEAFAQNLRRQGTRESFNCL